jgi:pyridoxal 5'-phosphate synthase pdxT subunit
MPKAFRPKTFRPKAFRPMIVGVLALQGDFALHQRSLEMLEIRAPKIRRPGELDAIDGLIVPGGESTTFTKMLRETGLFDAIRIFASEKPVMGTCAGLITLASRLLNDNMETLGLINLEVERNAYGRQVDSFTAPVRFPGLPPDSEFPGVFIRAPRIRSIGAGTEAAAFRGDEPVAAMNGNVLATAFHPELTDDTRIHRFFVERFISRKIRI